MSKFTKQSESTNEINRRKSNLRDGLAVGVILLVALLIGSAPQAVPGNPATKDIVWAAVSTIGVIALLLVSYLGYRRADERQQLIQLKASSITFLVMLLGLFATEMLYALKQINVIPVIQILFIGSIVLCILLQKVIESRTR
jgi:hypothetical protein